MIDCIVNTHEYHLHFLLRYDVRELRNRIGQAAKVNITFILLFGLFLICKR